MTGKGREMSDEQVQKFAKNLVDDLRIAETIADRDKHDTGERITLKELAADLGLEDEL